MTEVDQLCIGATTSMLVEKLLRLERPQITMQMQPLLEEEESRAVFLSYLLSPKDLEEKAIKQSYWISKLLSEDIVAAKVMTKTYDRRFVSTLMSCFRAGAPCHLPHVAVILSALLRGCNDVVTSILAESTSSCLVHFTALCEFADVPMVSGLIQDTVCLPAPLPGHPSVPCSPELQQMLKQRLAECDVWSVFVRTIVSSDVTISKSIAAADCFMSSLKRAAVSPHAEPLAKSLADSASRLVANLLSHCHETLIHSRETPANENEVTRLGLCIDSLLSLLEWTKPPTVDAPSTASYQSFGGSIVMRAPNVLHSAFSATLGSLVEHRVLLFDLLKRQLATTLENPSVRHTGYITSVPFSTTRLNLIHILHIMLVPVAPGDDVHLDLPVHVIEEIPDDLWRLLGSLFCAYPHSNLYHHVFVQIFSFVLASGSDKAVKAIIKRAKKKKKKVDVGFISRCLRHYCDEDKNSSVRGHILKCLNIVRLRAQTSSIDSALCTYLRDLQEWREFLPKLEEETLRMCAKPKIDRPTKWGEEPQTNFGIELGSPWAISLGFDKDLKKVVKEVEEEKEEDNEDEFRVVD